MEVWWTWTRTRSFEAPSFPPQRLCHPSSSHAQFVHGVPGPPHCRGPVTVPTLCQRRPDLLPRGRSVKTETAFAAFPGRGRPRVTSGGAKRPVRSSCPAKCRWAPGTQPLFSDFFQEPIFPSLFAGKKENKFVTENNLTAYLLAVSVTKLPQHGCVHLCLDLRGALGSGQCPCSQFQRWEP